jgi:hypothetical protein
MMTLAAEATSARKSVAFIDVIEHDHEDGPAMWRSDGDSIFQ